MKIDSPKLAPAPRTAERPQLSTTTATPKSGNTGIVPSAAQPKPADTFEKTATGSTSPNTGIVPTSPPKTQSISTYSLPPELEPHRAEIDKFGEHIAKMPSQVQGKAIDNATDKLYGDFGDIATRDTIFKAVKDSVAYYASRPTTTDDPQCFRVVHSTENAVGSTFDYARDLARTAPREPSSPSTSAENLLRRRQPRQQQQPTDETRQLFRRMPRWF